MFFIHLAAISCRFHRLPSKSSATKQKIAKINGRHNAIYWFFYGVRRVSPVSHAFNESSMRHLVPQCAGHVVVLQVGALQTKMYGPETGPVVETCAGFSPRARLRCHQTEAYGDDNKSPRNSSSIHPKMVFKMATEV